MTNENAPLFRQLPTPLSISWLPVTIRLSIGAARKHVPKPGSRQVFRRVPNSCLAIFVCSPAQLSLILPRYLERLVLIVTQEMSRLVEKYRRAFRVVNRQAEEVIVESHEFE